MNVREWVVRWDIANDSDVHTTLGQVLVFSAGTVLEGYPVRVPAHRCARAGACRRRGRTPHIALRVKLPSGTTRTLAKLRRGVTGATSHRWLRSPRP